MLNLIGTLPIETDRLRLRRFTFQDNAAALKNWAGDPAVQKLYLEPVYESPEAVHRLLETYIASYEKPETFRWAITLPDTDECIGQAAFFMVDVKNHFAELEYCIGRAFQRRGYVTEAVNGILQFGFETINLHKAQVCHTPTNQGSKGVIQKCGFTYEGTLRDYFYMDGRYVDRLYYSMLQSEWRGRHNG